MMKPKHNLYLVLAAIFILLVGSVAFAADPPHVPPKVSCASCHQNAAYNQPSGGNIDNTPYNLVCKSCHGGGSAKAKVTHSANTSDSTYWGGTWSIECRVCHDPHQQRQPYVYPSDYPAGAWLTRGPVVSIVGNVLTVSGNPWQVGQWDGRILQPNTNFKYYVRIASTTTNALYAETNIPLSIGNKPNIKYAIAYGQMMTESMNLRRGVTGASIAKIMNSQGVVFSTNWDREVKLFNSTGPASTSYSNADASANTTAACVVCHTRTSYKNYGYAKWGTSFDTIDTAKYESHAESDTSTCWENQGSCHKPPDTGFKVAGAKCGDCHGNPPTSVSGLVSRIKVANSIYNTATGVSTDGAHKTHNDRYPANCRPCHFGGMLVVNENDADIGDYKTTISFILNTSAGPFYNAGKYNGTAMVNGFVYNGYSVGTVDGSMACSNVYCHGAKMPGNLGTKLVPKWNETGVAAGCSWCHQGTAANPPQLGSHAKHTGNSSTMVVAQGCGVCHPHTGSLTLSTHIDGMAQWAFSSSNPLVSGAIYNNLSSGLRAPVPSSSYGNCSALYCHSTGYPAGKSIVYKNLQWGGSQMNCGSCHDMPSTGSSTWSAAHDRHVDGAGSYVYTCNACHSTVALNNAVISNKSLHVDGIEQVSINAVWGGTWGGVNCTNTKCHSTGDRLGGAGYGYAIQGWNGSIGCSACHKAADTVASMRAGAGNMTDVHVIHVSTEKYGLAGRGVKRIECKDCHRDSTSGGSTVFVANHVNLIKEVKFDTTWTADTPVWNGTNYRCSNTYCHSDGVGVAGKQVPIWTNAASGACGACHGVSAANPPTSAAHTKHVGSGNVYKYECYKCHAGIVTYTANSTVVPQITLTNGLPNHVDKVVNNIFNTADIAVRGDSPSIDGLKTCSNVFCHSMGKLSVPAANIPGGYSKYAYIKWNDPATTCQSCHGRSRLDGRPDYTSGAKGGPDADSHTNVAAHLNAPCATCHVTVVPVGNSPVTGSAHVNGKLDVIFNTSGTWAEGAKSCSGLNSSCHTSTPVWGGVGGCTSCHGQPPVDAATALKSGYDSGRKNDFTNASGLHNYHYGKLGFNKCDYCHRGADGVANHNSSPTKRLNLGFDVNGAYTYGFYQATAFSNASYVLNSSSSGTVVQTAAGGRWCSNLYCHSDGGNYAGQFTYRYANWDVGGNGTPTNACNICHGSGSMAAVTNVHPKHVNGATYNYTCAECHSKTVNGTNIIVGNHVDKIKNVAFGGPVSGIGNYVRPSCSSTYCHSPGTKNSAFDPPLQNPMWSGTLSGCTGCHAGDAGASQKMSTRAHGTHINNASKLGWNMKCSECHNATVSMGNTVVGGFGNHVNRLVNVKFDPNGINNNAFGPRYGGTLTNAASGASFAPGYVTRNCSAVYCHSNGNKGALTFISVAWDGAGIGCGGCHGDDANNWAHPRYATGAPGSNTANSHISHVENSGYGCDRCHKWTVSDISNRPNSVRIGGAHINGTEDVSFILITNKTGVYNADKSCSSTYCHGTLSPKWGAGDVDCGNCHYGSSNLAQGHALHYGTSANATVLSSANIHNATKYIYGCGNCHPDSALGTHAMGPRNGVGPAFQSAEVNGTMMTLGNYTPGGTSVTDSKGYNYTIGGTCSTYCHSDGAGVYATPVWNATATGGCDDCHGNADTSPINSGKHGVHISDGTYDYKCEECHFATVTGDSTINLASQRDTHTNMVRDVAWKTAGLNVGGSAYSAPTCSNIYCHSEGQKAAAPYTSKTVGWSDGALGCSGCHGGTAGAGSMATGSHRAHIDNAGLLGANFNCQHCHDLTASGNAVGSIANHIDKKVAVKFFGGANTTGLFNGVASSKRDPGNAARSCSALYCHSTGKANVITISNLPAAYGGSHFSNVAWGSAGIGCDGCHGKTSTTAGRGWPDYTSNPINNGTSQANSHAVGSHKGTFCGTCHSETVASGTDSPIKGGSARHINGTAASDVLFNTGAGGGSGAWYNTTTKACNSITCHGNLVWGGVGGCNTCHGNPPISNAASQQLASSSRLSQFVNAEGSHLLHKNKGLTNCDYCHYGGGSSGAHDLANKTVNVGFSFGNLGGVYNAPAYSSVYNLVSGHAATTVNKTGSRRLCSAVYCHSDGGSLSGVKSYAIANWDAVTSTGACNVCHGTAGGALVLTDHHPKHTATYAYTCYECHSGTVNQGNALIGNHVNNAKEVAWGTVASGSSAYSKPACSNNYCHSEGRNAGAPYTAITVNWSAGSLGCNGCHGGTAGAGSIATEAHKSHIDNAGVLGVNYACQNCHDLTSSGNAISSVANHVDKVVAVKFFGGANATGLYNGATSSKRAPGNAARNCSALYCHSTGKAASVAIVNLPAAYGGSHFSNVAWDGAAIVCSGCHGRTTAKGWPDYTTGPKGTAQANSHPKHSTIICSECHYRTTRNDSSIYDLGGYTAHINGTINVVYNALGQSSTATIDAGKSCSATYCHGVASPQWGDVGATNCSSCHYNQGSRSAAQYTGAHGAHVNSAAGNYRYACEQCHQAENGASKVSHGGGPSGVTNMTAEVKWAQTAGVINYPSGGGPAAFVFGNLTVNPYNGTSITQVLYINGSYAGLDPTNAKVQWSRGTCSNVWCHSNASPMGKADDFKKPIWNSTALSCTGCHTGPGGADTWSAAHDRHTETYTYTCGACHSSVALNNSAISNKALHVDGLKQVLFNGFANAAATYSTVNKQCTNTYCHSAGTSFTGTSHSGLAWTAGAQGCSSCHGNPPAYSSGKANSHLKHGSNCTSCHFNTTTNSSTITNAAGHVDRFYNLLNNSPSVTFAVSTQGTPVTPTVCSNISCHGGTGSDAQWGTTPACSSCHLKNSVDVDNFIWNGATGSGLAVINQTEWTGSGHGRTSSTYSVSGNTAANLTCASCHDEAVAHNQPANYFRLKNIANGTWNQNWNCQTCHASGQPAKGGGGADKKITSRHFGADHGASPNKSGQFCWDCHDPHGDSNIYMVQRRPWLNSSASTMLPVAFTANNVTFINNANGSYYVNATTFDGVCNVCHTQSAVGHHRYNYDDGHYSSPGQRCASSNCHPHNQAINNAFTNLGGGCDSCHGYPPKPWYMGGGDGLANISVHGKGVHNSHAEQLKTITGYTLNAATDQWGDGQTMSQASTSVQKLCGVCHMGATHSTSGGPRTIAMNAATYKFGPNNPTYQGVVGTSGAQTPKTCSNVSCHYIKTPEWESY